MRRDSDESDFGLESTWMDVGGAVIEIRHKNMYQSSLVHASEQAHRPIHHVELDGKQPGSWNRVSCRSVAFRVPCLRWIIASPYVSQTER